MNDRKLKQLFDQARRDPAPAPGPEFPDAVLRAIRRETFAPTPVASPVWEQLNGWFPRVAVAAAAVIALCVAADFGLTAAGVPGATDGAAQIASDYFFDLQAL
jgi:anti-sigma-K factor RskA